MDEIMDDFLKNPGVPEKEEAWWKGPLGIILALFLLLLLVVWYVPGEAVKLDPEPKGIPKLSEVVPEGLTITQEARSLQPREYPSFVTPDSTIKQIADKIVTRSCDGNKVCHAKALYYFVRDNLQYVSDPAAYEYVKSARESLVAGGGDCDDAAVLLASLLESVGINTQFVFVPNHVYIRALLPEAAKRYKLEDSDYVSLDPTCRTCAFGELPYADATKNKVVVS
ncbi:transglutaminase domain-containing protein [Candidatus Woesearchaeota archaeon]|nr:transglutaminase domain-containing protein [Candidatus Woesearchaeota archaeon]